MHEERLQITHHNLMPFPLTPEKYAHTRTHTHTHTHAHTRTHTYTAKLLATSAPQTPHPPERLKPCLQLFALVQQPVVEIDQVGQLVHGGGVLCKLLGTARCLCVCACVCMCVCVCVCMCVCMTVCVWPAGPWWWGAVQAVGHCKVCVCVLVCVCVFVCVHVCVCMTVCVCMASWSVVVGCCASCWALQKQSKASVWMFEQPQKYHSSICWHVVVLNRTRTRNSSSGSSSSSDYKVKTKLGALKC